MGTAGAEGSGPALRGLDVEDAGQDETIRDKDGETGHNDVDACHDENYQLNDIGTCAGELKQRVDVTEIMVNSVCITEVQSLRVSSVSHGPENAIQEELSTRLEHTLGDIMLYKSGLRMAT